MTILAEVAEITPHALNRLFESYKSGLPTVKSVRATRLPGGYGYLSHTFRLHIEWSGEGHSTAPGTLIAKLPLRDRLESIGPSERRMYRREAMFHQEVAPIAPIRVARAYANHIDGTGVATLIFEDLGHLESYSDDEDISVERIGTALERLAVFHAKYRGNVRLDQFDWLANPSKTGVDQVPAERFIRLWPQLVASEAYELSPVLLRLGELLGARIDGVYEALHRGPEALIHADIHPENMFFDGVEPVIIDWQLAERGNPAKDAAKLIASSIAPGTLQSEQPGLLQRYVGALREFGNTGRDFSQTPAEMMASFTRDVHLATCHYLAMMTFLSDGKDFDALAQGGESRTDFSTRRVIAVCDREEVLAVIEDL